MCSMKCVKQVHIFPCQFKIKLTKLFNVMNGGHRAESMIS